MEPADETPVKNCPSASRTAGMVAFQQKRKQDSRERLLQAAIAKFCAGSYHSVSVEDIASAAGMNRVTFYRHFSSKMDLAFELFQRASTDATERLLAIGGRDFLDRQVVAQWIAGMFETKRANRQLVLLFLQAGAEEPGFSERQQGLIGTLINQLGTVIPAFNVHRGVPTEHARWLEAWMLIYELLDHSNHAALGTGIGNDPQVIDILTSRFLRFVSPLS